MKKIIGFAGILFLLAGNLFSQSLNPLFDSQEPLEIRMKFSIKELRSETNDSTYLDSFLLYKSEEGSWDTVDIDLRTRGNFRKDNCYYPPLRVKIKKKHAKETVFEGNKSLKLVLPCNRVKNADSFIAKEFLCYKLYEELSPYTFQTRMLKVTLENEDDKKGEKVELLGFFIEDDDLVAERFGGEILEDVRIIPTFMQDTAVVRHDFFQFLIGNTDWSSMYRHNEKVLKLDQSTVVPLAYDFDMTGLVNPPYAQVSNLVDIEKVTDRLYRGYCRDPEMMEFVRQEFLAKEEIVWQLVESAHSYMDEADRKACSRFLRDFFDILKNDLRFESMILEKCRTQSS
ncbi:hypothetical protein [Algoriphagus sp. CAU 1675]|uniref:hypothetical protein n=1 Tax=Algoriphagus sp. CAU 1675 TaxID=3032597 RepID=UPI0023DB7D50|nr:hypothetical protein [Algoriphagus sp. CAU 1675]MDF2158492.1 hypothetical protein [Algoriphagus sp. CAU 1675]